MRTLLLPGMDGTGLLFGGLTRALPTDIDPVATRYPTSEALGYDALLARLEVPAGDIAIVAESFSGPLGIRLAALLGDRVRALVLVATFARSPSLFVRPAHIFAPILFRRPPPRIALRTFLLDQAASDDEVDELDRVIRSVRPSVMTKRLAEIARVDVRDSLALLRCPTLYLAGKRDRLVSRGALDVIRSAMPSIAVETVDAPHLVVQRNPVDSALLIGNFIRSTM